MDSYSIEIIPSLNDPQTPEYFQNIVQIMRDFGVIEQLDQDKRIPPPASKEFVKNLPVIQIDGGTTCTVCLKQFVKDARVRELPCKHQFHLGCILPWLRKTSTCPMCRFDLPTDDVEYEEYKKAKKRLKQKQEEMDFLHNSMYT